MRRILPLPWILPALVLCSSTWYVVAESGKGSMDSPMVLSQRQARVECERGSFSTTPQLAEGIKASLVANCDLGKSTDIYTQLVASFPLYLNINKFQLLDQYVLGHSSSTELS